MSKRHSYLALGNRLFTRYVEDDGTLGIAWEKGWYFVRLGQGEHPSAVIRDRLSKWGWEYDESKSAEETDREVWKFQVAPHWKPLPPVK